MLKALTIEQTRDVIELAADYRGRFTAGLASDRDANRAYAEDLENPQKRALYQAIKKLPPAARRELTVLMWVGRGVYQAAEWPAACRYAGANQTNGDLLYMLENGPLGEQLARGLEMLERGLDPEDAVPD
jgi:hypothetical protein